MNEQKNLILAVVASMAILFAFNFFYEQPKFHEEQARVAADNIAIKADSKVSENHVLPSSKGAVNDTKSDIQETPVENIKIQTDKVSGNISTQGVTFSEFSLKKYPQTTAEDSPNVDMLTTAGTQIHSTWELTDSQSDMNMPNQTTIWQRIGKNTHLTQMSPVTLQWTNPQGLVFKKVISIDENYLITMTESVTNQAEKSVSLFHSASVKRPLPESNDGMMISHEGPIGVWKEKLQEFSYDDISEETKRASAKGGWIGFGDKYWLTSLMPDRRAQVNYELSQSDDHKFTARLIHKAHMVQPGEKFSVVYYAFSGPKKLHLLDTYEEKFGFSKFDLAVDFGWFYFLTKPLFLFLNWLYAFLGNMGLAILILTILSKVALYPLASKSFRSMAKLKTLQPKMERVRATYKSDPQRMQQEMMKLYKKEEVNPMGGCLPMVIQAPIFFCLYKVFYVTIEMRHAPFFGWIKDLSAPDPTSLFNLFGLLSFTPPSFLQIGLLPIVMGLTMLLQQRLGPQPADPSQAKVMMVLPIMFTFLFASFPSGVVIYWTFSNLLGIAQQTLMTRGAK